MPSRRTERFPVQRGRGIQLSASTRHAKRASGCEHPPCLSPPDSGCGTERSKAASQWRCSLAAATWSEVQQTANGRSQANPRRQSACAGAVLRVKAQPRRNEKRSRSARCLCHAAQSADVLVLVVPPLQGLRIHLSVLPRALPWAIILRPVGASEADAAGAVAGTRRSTRRQTFCQRSEVGGASRTGRNAVLAQRCLCLSRD